MYTSETLALAALENLVHYDKDNAPVLVASGIAFPDDLAVAEIEDLPDDWRTLPAPLSTQEAGALWLRDGDTAVLRVPSIIIPREANYIFNPAHSDFAHVSVVAQEAFAYDPRLL